MSTKCPQCEHEIPAGNDVCHYCGYKPKLVERKVQKTISSDGTNVLKFISIAAFFIMFAGIIVMFYLQGVITVTVVAPQNSNIGLQCTKSADCQVPMEYLVRSNCPYQAFCADYQCVVACPMWEDRRNEWKVKCKADEDCDCKMWDSEGKYECRCLEQQCVSVVDVVK